MAVASRTWRRKAADEMYKQGWGLSTFTRLVQYSLQWCIVRVRFFTHTIPLHTFANDTTLDPTVTNCRHILPHLLCCHISYLLP